MAREEGIDMQRPHAVCLLAQRAVRSLLPPLTTARHRVDRHRRSPTSLLEANHLNPKRTIDRLAAVELGLALLRGSSQWGDVLQARIPVALRDHHHSNAA